MKNNRLDSLLMIHSRSTTNNEKGSSIANLSRGNESFYSILSEGNSVMAVGQENAALCLNDVISEREMSSNDIPRLDSLSTRSFMQLHTFLKDQCSVTTIR